MNDIWKAIKTKIFGEPKPQEKPEVKSETTPYLNEESLQRILYIYNKNNKGIIGQAVHRRPDNDCNMITDYKDNTNHSFLVKKEKCDQLLAEFITSGYNSI